MTRVRPAVPAATLLSFLALAACGAATGEEPRPDADGRVPATPRALAAVVVEHVDPGRPRRSTGDWSDWNDPLSLEAQVDYGVDPEGTEDGETRTVRVDVTEIGAFSAADRAWFRCRPAHESGGCEEQVVDGARLLFHWRPGTEEEEGGSYAWTVVRDDEVVTVAYDRSALFEEDPRGLGLAVEPEDLRAAALDPAMSLRTTPEAHAAGAELGGYEGAEEPPEEPQVSRTTPRELAARLGDYLGPPAEVRRSALDDFGAGAVGAHLTYPATTRHAAFSVDVLTTVGRVPQIDPLPCPVQDARGAADAACFAWDDDTAATWTLASDGRPGALWIIGAQDDESFNRVESVGIRVVSTAIDAPLFTDPQALDGLPETMLGDLAGFTADRTVGPEQQRTER